ncbi:hypothetical protein SEA_ASEGATO_11 [Microbacterium phage ASegato]|nr:hypothetical protein SEA_ASEGATO_11 [Microbacterium phage ASegato]
MADKNGALDLTILANINGIAEVDEALRKARLALGEVFQALEKVNVQMEVE